MVQMPPIDPGNRALFLDLAGTLVRLDSNRELPRDASGKIVVELLPWVAERLKPEHSYLMFVVTNQAGISRGHITYRAVETAIHELDRMLGGILTAWQVCPHTDADRCDCRKPKPGMVKELAATYGVDLAGSIMVGDQPIDEQCAAAAGIGTFIYAAEFFGWKG
jgi:D-glycero-D-manno-heptose 1,7-bisphosphate phosphatase